MNAQFSGPVGPAAAASGSRTARRPWASLIAYSIAAALGGASGGLLFGELGRGLAVHGLERMRVVWLASGLVVALAVARELVGRLTPFPERRAQVPKRWLNWPHPTWWASAYGFVLGMGVLTYIHHAVGYVLLVLLLLAPNVTTAAMIGLVYGLAWASVAIVASVSRDPGAGFTRGFRGIAMRRYLVAAALVSYAAAGVIQL